MKRIAQIIFLTVTAAELLAVPLLTVFGEHEGVSYYEQRRLAAVPEPTKETVLDGTFFSALETLYQDHITSRDELLKLNTTVDMAMGRVKVNNVIVTDDRLLDVYGFSRWGLGYLVNDAAVRAEEYAALQEKITSYGGYFCYLGVPQQSTYFAADYPAFMDSRLWHTTGIREAFFPALEARGIPYVNMYAEFQAVGAPEEYYYDTDHHYTGQGAFFTYLTLMEHLQIAHPDLQYLGADDFTWTTLKNPFLGSTNRKLYALWDTKDAVSYAEPKESIPYTRTDRGTPVGYIHKLPATEEEVATYSVYMGGDIAETVISTNRPELPNILIYGDSFSNPIESVIWTNFNETRTVDFRYYTEKTLTQYIEEYRPDYVVCVRDESTFFSKTANGATE